MAIVAICVRKRLRASVGCVTEHVCRARLLVDVARTFLLRRLRTLGWFTDSETLLLAESRPYAQGR